jgi:hypothetical protein
VDDLSYRLSEAEYELRDKKDVIKLTRSRIEEVEKQVVVLQTGKVKQNALQIKYLSSWKLIFVGTTRLCLRFDRW